MRFDIDTKKASKAWHSGYRHELRFKRLRVQEPARKKIFLKTLFQIRLHLERMALPHAVELSLFTYSYVITQFKIE